MGPGLFFALVLLSCAVWAESPVGLEARGVDPMSAIDNRLGLDVRDEQGRPVSGQVVLEQLKKASVARTAANSFTSELPRARFILPALELAVGCGTWLIQLAEALPLVHAVASLPTPRPKISAVLPVPLGDVLARRTPRFGAREQQAPLFCCRCSLEILRC